MAQEKDKSSTLITVAVISAVATICAACVAGVFTNLEKLFPTDSPRTGLFTQEVLPLPTQPNHLLPTTTPEPLPTNTPRPSPTSTPWTAGIEDPSNPHVIASSNEGSWLPDYGYRWQNPDDEGDFQVVPIIENVTVDHNVSMDGANGMTIHIQFTVNDGYQNVPCRATAYFYFSNPEKALIAGDDHYSTSDGKVAVGNDFTPNYSITTYKDLQLFLPYSALNMSDDVKEADLKFYVLLYKKPSKDIAESDWVYFTYTRK